MTERIFRSIFTVALAVLIVSTSLIMWAAYDHSIQTQSEQLRIGAGLAARSVAREGMDYLNTLRDFPECRITWIDANGRVLFDNRRELETMSSHSQREEVAQALATGYGQSVRYSDTLLERSVYAAQRLPDGTVLRLSTTQSSLLSLILSMSQYIILIFAVILVMSYCLSRRLSKNVVKPINELDLDDPLSNHQYQEIQPLLQRLDAQQAQLRGQSTELKRKQKEFNTVTRSLNEGLVLLNSTGTILSINPAAARLLAVTPNCLGADFSVANQVPAIAALVDQALAGEKAEQTIPLAAGEYLAAARPVRSDGTLFGVVLLLFDVTEKRRTEQLRREFTANVSHELKTPLHAISGYAELMKSGLVPAGDMAAFSEKIYAEAQRMISLVEDTLRLSRLDEGMEELCWTQVDLYAAAENALKKLSGPAELNHVQLKLEGAPAQIRGIRQLVDAIVFNLTDNAVKYSQPGGTVTLRVIQKDGQTVLTVSDQGIGIPEADRDRVFERFYRVDKSHSKEVGGTGLGLSIVKHAAAILHAQVTLESTQGKGTTVTVLFS